MSPPRKRKGPLSKEAISMIKWTNQDWRTKSGKNSIVGKKATGERYMPASAVKSLTPAEHASTTKAKRKGIKKGKQFVPNTKGAKKKITKARKA